MGGREMRIEGGRNGEEDRIQVCVSRCCVSCHRRVMDEW